MAYLPWVPAPGGKDQEDPKGLPPIPVSTDLTSLGLSPLPVLSEPSAWNFLVSLPLTPCLTLRRTEWRHYAVDDVMAPAQIESTCYGKGHAITSLRFHMEIFTEFPLPTHSRNWYSKLAPDDGRDRHPGLQGAH